VQGTTPKGRTIGALAAAAGVHVETVRYYERRGLLAKPRAVRGWRRYDDQALQTLRFVKRAQKLGFSLAEIAELLALRRSTRERTCARVRARAQEKLAEVDAKLRDLLAIRGALAELAAACPAEGPAGRCPILSALAGEPLREDEPVCETGAKGGCCDG
jgi:Hg(II)-responsive transcriptional regulator